MGFQESSIIQESNGWGGQNVTCLCRRKGTFPRNGSHVQSAPLLKPTCFKFNWAKMSELDQWIADRTRNFDSSGIRKVFDLAAKLKDPINLSIGQPDFDARPSPMARMATHRRRGFCRYAKRSRASSTMNSDIRIERPLFAAVLVAGCCCRFWLRSMRATKSSTLIRTL